MEERFEPELYKVFARADEQGRITAINSSAFLTDTSGGVEIDSGMGDKFHHAQGNYLESPLMDERGLCSSFLPSSLRPLK